MGVDVSPAVNTLTVARWSGRETRALREALRLSVRAFAEYLGVAVGTVAYWEHRARSIHLSTQDMLDQALKLADADVRDRFRQMLNQSDNDALAARQSGSAPTRSRSKATPIDSGGESNCRDPRVGSG